MGKKLVTSVNSPFTVQFPSDSAVLGDESFSVDRGAGNAIVAIPAISSTSTVIAGTGLGGTLNQKVVFTNVVGSGETVVYPAAFDSIGAGPVGEGLLLTSGYGEVWRFQPASDNIWSVESPDGYTPVYVAAP